MLASQQVEPRSAVGSPAWKAPEAHYKKVRNVHLRNLFADDPTRGERLTTSAAGIELDYSKNRITDETLGLLLQLAADAGLRERIDAFHSALGTSPYTASPGGLCSPCAAGNCGAASANQGAK